MTSPTTKSLSSLERGPFYVTKKEEGLSLLLFLWSKIGGSKKSIKKGIDRSGCLVNQRRERFASYALRLGDVIRFDLEEELAPTLLFEDAYFQAWEKPPFYACDPRFTLHRLDKETSGILLTSEEESFFDLFYHRKIEKTYYAICQGVPKEREGTIEGNIKIASQRQGQKVMKIDSSGQKAITHWERLSRRGDLSLIKCKPVTGRTHQIRLHLSSIGIPVFGDRVYGKGSFPGATRILLHAHSLKFVHPITHKKMMLTSKIPHDFLEWFSEDLYS